MVPLPISPSYPRPEKLWIVIIVVELTLTRHPRTLSLLFAHTHPPSPSRSLRRFFFSVVFFFECFSTHIFPKADFILCLVIPFFCSPSCWCRIHHHVSLSPSLSLYRCAMVNVLRACMCICARPRIFTNFCNIVKFLCIACLLSFLAIHIFTHTPKIQPF